MDAVTEIGIVWIVLYRINKNPVSCRVVEVVSEYRNVILLRFWTSDDLKMMKNVQKYSMYDNQLVVLLLNDTQIRFTL